MLHVVAINWLFLGMVAISACHVQAELLVIKMFKLLCLLQLVTVSRDMLATCIVGKPDIGISSFKCVSKQHLFTQMTLMT